MKKEFKIKRHNSIYSTGKKNSAKTVLIAAIVVCSFILLFYLGWKISPIISGSFNVVSAPSVSVDTTEEPYLKGGSDDSVENNKKNNIESTDDFFMSGLFFPVAGDQDTRFESFLISAQKAKYSTIVVDAKDAAGRVLFDTKNPTAIKADAAVGQPYVAAQVSSAIMGKGMIPAARIHAFRDNIAPHANRNMGVKYQDTQMLWLDDYPDSGGSAWLNPYSSEAREYVISLAVELTEMGFRQIILDSVMFPVGFALDKAKFSDKVSLSKVDMLNQFAAEIKRAVSAAGGEAILLVDAVQLSDNYVASPYEVNGLDISGNRFIIGYFPSSIPADTKFFGNDLNDAVKDPGSLISQLVKKCSDDSEVIIMISVSKDDGSVSTGREISAIKGFASYAGAKGVILYDDEGKYALG
jgi:hypothetical protein